MTGHLVTVASSRALSTQARTGVRESVASSGDSTCLQPRTASRACALMAARPSRPVSRDAVRWSHNTTTHSCKPTRCFSTKACRRARQQSNSRPKRTASRVARILAGASILRRSQAASLECVLDQGATCRIVTDRIQEVRRLRVMHAQKSKSVAMQTYKCVTVAGSSRLSMFSTGARTDATTDSPDAECVDTVTVLSLALLALDQTMDQLRASGATGMHSYAHVAPLTQKVAVVAELFVDARCSHSAIDSDRKTHTNARVSLAPVVPHTSLQRDESVFERGCSHACSALAPVSMLVLALLSRPPLPQMSTAPAWSSVGI